jgi:glycosyltransferase involved in cell wall biosynthesis
MTISVIIPAYNEEKWIRQTLESVDRAKRYLLARGDSTVETLVVDNASADRTALIARSLNAKVVQESDHVISKVRNAGAKAASGDIFVFIDADVTIPEALLWRIAQILSDPSCIGGAVDTNYQPNSLSVKVYLQIWRMIGKAARMAQGAVQFFRRDAYFSLGGYDESLYMGEDVDFYWRFQRQAMKQGSRVQFMRDVQVVSSCRRFDQWPIWRTLIWTNPFVVLLFRRKKRFWDGWYGRPPR